MRKLTVHTVDLYLRAVGDADATLILFLHGFPEYSGAWKEVLPAFADQFHAVAPDQRGYALSAKPVGVEAYRTKQLLHDVLALADRLSPDRPFSIVAHDGGASVAYATAIAAPLAPSKARWWRRRPNAETVPTCMSCATHRPRKDCRPIATRSCSAC